MTTSTSPSPSAPSPSSPVPVVVPGPDAPLTLSEPPNRSLGFRDTLGLWGNLGISLLLPVAAVYVFLPGRPLWVTLAAIIVGATIGSLLLGLSAAAGAREGVPAMVLLRGLLGRRVSYLPTVLNLVQCVGWATFEIVIIAEAASRSLHTPRWPFVLMAGVFATIMALKPLGAVRVLARFSVWLSLAAVAYLVYKVLSQPLHTPPGTGATSFWTAADIVIALPVSWFPLAADYTRHVRGGRPAFGGSALGYGAATVAFFTLGVLALYAYGQSGLDVIGALLAVPYGVLALVVLLVLELDEAFANIYSTAISAQNMLARVDRRLLALIVGAGSTLLALWVDIKAYEAFLFLIGAVFVPLVGVFVVAYFVMPRRAWDSSATAPSRPWLLLPWVAGFAAYQLTLPTDLSPIWPAWSAWWGARQQDLGIDAANGMSASLVSLAVATVLAVLVLLPSLRRQRSVHQRSVPQ
jgi:NCS1 family nucleobase:cation symporter-1